MSSLTVTRAAVLRDGRRVALVRHAGPEIVILSAESRPRRLGRILPAGYTDGRTDSGGRYDLWTAKHPMVHVPSDTVIARNLTLAECAGMALEAATSDRRANPVCGLQAFLIT